ncbi:hypothetical protein BLX88_04705, partial [Bacillus obstructivus]
TRTAAAASSSAHVERAARQQQRGQEHQQATERNRRAHAGKARQHAPQRRQQRGHRQARDRPGRQHPRGPLHFDMAEAIGRQHRIEDAGAGDEAELKTEHHHDAGRAARYEGKAERPA